MKKLLIVCFMAAWPFAEILAQPLTLKYNWTDSTLPPTNAFGNAYNEIWGTVQKGKEYAIIGSTMAIHIFDVSNKNNIYQATAIPTQAQGPAIINRDFHDYKNYLYIVADQGASTLQIADLSFLPDSAPVVYNSNALFSRAHTIYIDSINAILYACGGNNLLNLYSLADPKNPTLLLNCSQQVPGWNAIGYVHDIYVRNNIAFCSAGTNGLFIVDFSDLSNVTVLGSLTNYPEKGYNHSGRWHATKDIFVFTDETHNTGVKIIDFSDRSNITVESIIRTETHPNFTIAHDVSIRGDFLYISYYYDGVQVYDISNPKNPVWVTDYATSTIPHRNSFEGCWGIYALAPSNLIYASDMQNGLFVFETSGVLNIQEKEFVSKPNAVVYPNPASDALFVQGISESFEITISDVSGKTIMKSWQQETDRIGISHLPKGIYIVQISTTNSTFVQKVIKQ